MRKNDSVCHVEVLRGAERILGKVERLNVREAIGLHEKGSGNTVEPGGGEVQGREVWFIIF